MRVRLAQAVAVTLDAVLVSGCGGQVGPSSSQFSTDLVCSSLTTVPSDGCWQAVLPPGSGGYPPGSENTPLWEPGRFPLTLTPYIAYEGNLWMTAQTRAY